MNVRKENLKAIISLHHQFKNLSFDDSYKQIEILTNNIVDCVQRAQYRLYSAFCLYHYQPKGSPIPRQVLEFHKDLYGDFDDFSSKDFFSRWVRFRSPSFIKALHYASKGNENLEIIIKVIKLSEPTTRNIIPILKENPSKKELIDQMKLPFLSEVPKINPNWNIKYKLI